MIWQLYLKSRKSANKRSESALKRFVSWMYLDIFEWRENLSVVGMVIFIPPAMVILSVWRPLIFSVRLLISLAFFPVAMFIKLCVKDKLFDVGEYISTAAHFVINGLD